MRRLTSGLIAVMVACVIPILSRGGASEVRAQADAPPASGGSPAPEGPGSTSSAASTPAAAARPSALGVQVFNLRYRKVDDAYILISPFVGPLGSVRMQPAQRTLTVQDLPENLRRISGVIGSYDVPLRNVDVSVQLIMASAGGGALEPAPPPIRGVIDRLSALNTRWTGYKMVGNAHLRGMEGERRSLRVGDDYKIDFRIDEVSGDSRVIRFKPFELWRRDAVLEGPERYTSIMNTVLNLRDSQLFIVGASKAEQSDRALFMTITASLQRP